MTKNLQEMSKEELINLNSKMTFNGIILSKAINDLLQIGEAICVEIPEELWVEDKRNDEIYKFVLLTKKSEAEIKILPWLNPININSGTIIKTDKLNNFVQQTKK